MKGMCQTCGATAPLEWFLNEPVARQVLVAALKLPAPVHSQLLGYLGLFRPAGRSMQPKKALRLVQEIAALVAPEYVRVQGKAARKCPPRLWAQAMEQMSERRGSLRLPLKNHNYLRQIAWGLADAEDAANDAARREAEAAGNYRGVVPHPASGHPIPQGEVVDDGLLPIERAMRSREILPK
ncbi:MAG TPA: hypothetical protein ENN06_12615 [Desulfobacteraceae bacterium]|nr:hypothetical protein [Desulfobacteraceae bacterium]